MQEAKVGYNEADGNARALIHRTIQGETLVCSMKRVVRYSTLLRQVPDRISGKPLHTWVADYVSLGSINVS
jgi:hypothetical protein